jgi:hypothetical protein
MTIRDRKAAIRPELSPLFVTNAGSLLEGTPCGVRWVDGVRIGPREPGRDWLSYYRFYGRHLDLR